MDFILTLAQIYAADLAGNSLWKFEEFQSTNTFIRCKSLSAVLEDRLCGFGIWLESFGQCHVGFWNRQSNRIWRRHNRNFGYSGMFNHDGLQLKGGESVI